MNIWIQGARPRTLGASIVPVLVGTAAAPSATALRTLGCLVVGLGMQVGVNYANDYFDGRRGVDTAARVGPVRLTASGLASPRAVLMAALLALTCAGVAGLALAAVSSWSVLLIGAAAFVAALLYSGGPRPYASLGLGEVFVFAFFGLAAVCGTSYVQSGVVRDEAWWAAVPVGLLAVAILVTNNLRDIPTDAAAGKRTLAVRMGERATRWFYRALILAAMVIPIVGVVMKGLPVGALLALGALPQIVAPVLLVGQARELELVRVLQNTALTQAEFGVMLSIGLWLS